MITQLQKWIEEAKIITIFRHENPDLDAVGSQLGLKAWLQENYPDKKVFACGEERYKTFDIDYANDSDIEQSLAIILDTPTKERVDDDRFVLAHRKIKIDHHPQVEKIADLEFVDTAKAATCQYVPQLLEQLKPSGLSKKSATYFYQGILTDTLSFKTNNTTSETFEVAALLTRTGIDISQISREVLDKPMDVFEFLTFLRRKLEVFNGQIGYAILTVEDLEPFDMTMGQARGFVAEFGNIVELQAWALFTQSEQDKDDFKGSLRSKVIDLTPIASQYQGGGHKNACGVKGLTFEKVHEIIRKMDENCTSSIKK
ncbi:MAG: DHH family phosphoesterase [Anaerorhabdus sp.]